MDQYKLFTTVIEKKFGIEKQVSVNQSTRERTMAIAKAQAEMHDFYVITSDQFISAKKLKTNENGSISIEKRIKIFQNFSWKFLVLSKEVSFGYYLIQTLPCIFTTDSRSVLFQEKNKSKLCPGNDDFGNIIAHQVSKTDYILCQR